MLTRLFRRTGVVAWQRIRGSDSGMSTAEYAVGTIAAVAFAAVLYGIITGTPVTSALAALVTRALSVKF